MRNDRLSDDEITALLRGTAPHGRPDLEPLATLVDDLRFASSESSPRPSAAMTALLDADTAPLISTAAVGGLSQRSDRMPVPASAATAPRRGIASMFISWFTGLGLAAKIAIGATAAALGVLGAGAANALPPGIQQQFDGVVETVVPATAEDESDDDTAVVDDSTSTDDSATDDSAIDDSPSTDDSLETDDSGVDGVGDDDGTPDQGKTEHAQGVTDAAHDDSTEGREHGEAVSDAAHQNRGHGSVNSGPGNADDSDDSADDSADDSVDDSTDDSSDDSVEDEVEDESGDDNGTDDEGDDNDGSNSGSGKSGSGNSGSGSNNSGRGNNN